MARPVLRLGALLLALAACAGEAPPGPGAPPPDPAVPDTCGLSGVAGLTGGKVGRLPDAGGWQSLRVIRPGQAVTMDFSPTRLNVELDGTDRILRMSCG